MEWWQMLLYILFLVIGMVLLVKGADWFVDGASSIAKALKIPSLIIGLTLVSMGTSAPEAAVSITSAVNQNVEMSVGNVVGSNIFNTLFIVGLSAALMPPSAPIVSVSPSGDRQAFTLPSRALLISKPAPSASGREL